MELHIGNFHIAEIEKRENKVRWVASDLINFFFRMLTCLPVHNIIIRDIVTLCENLLMSYALTFEFLKQKLHDISLILSLIDFITQRNTEQLHSSLISNCTMAYTYKCGVVFFGKRKVYNHS